MKAVNIARSILMLLYPECKELFVQEIALSKLLLGEKIKIGVKNSLHSIRNASLIINLIKSLKKH